MHKRGECMHHDSGWMERLALKVQLEEELLPGQSLIELLSDKRVLIEHHKGVIAFGNEEICVRLGCGILQICGQGLELEKMSNELLVITGRIQSLKIIRR